MSFKVATVQIVTVIALSLFAVWVFIYSANDSLILKVVNETGFPISQLAVRHKDQYCSVTTLQPAGVIGCTLDADGNTISIVGRVNDQAYVLENIGPVELGASFRNFVKLKPNMKYEITSKRVIN